MMLMINRGMDVGYLANMVVRVTLQELPCPTLAFVAFSGPSDIRAGPYNLQCPEPTILSPSPTIPAIQSFTLYRHARWAGHDTTGSDFTYMPIPDVIHIFVPIYKIQTCIVANICTSLWVCRPERRNGKRRHVHCSCMVNSIYLQCAGN